MLKKIGLKAAIFAMIVVVLVVGAVLFLLLNTTRSFTNELIGQQSKTANDAFQHTFQSYQEEALQRAEMIAGTGDVVDAILDGNSEALLKALNNLSNGLDLITLCDENGMVLARTHSDKTGDSVLSQKAISIALDTGKGIGTIEQGTVIGISTRGSAAIKDRDGNIIGALTCGHDLSQNKYIDEIKAQNNCEATFFAGSTRMSTTLTDESGNRVIGTDASDAVIQRVINEKQEYSDQIELFGAMYSVDYSPVIVDDTVIGMLFTGINIETSITTQRNMIIMIIVALVMLVLAVVITVLIIRSTTNKSHWYESMLDSIPFPLSVTDMNMKWTFINKPVEQMLNTRRSDMLGKHCSSWGAAICKTDNCGIACLEAGKNSTNFKQAGMDFRVDVSYLHNAKGKKIGHIEIVQDISEMVRNQNAQTEFVEKIRELSAAFVGASRQISDGTQSLAQGSTQQSASLEQLSASISEIAQKTKSNADMADRAAKLADTIKRGAEKGSRQMDEMIAAVKEINQAGQSISKVIKAIDDIAFQTNILALNAAVEAARAGQHGKGFAVVAEEVRNLASKSAEAAKDTGALIANSIEKAELGVAIAGDTAGSLADIVAGINESSVLVADIAASSDEQSANIEQINKGVEQVAQVVHTNSAATEETASAASELDGQSEVLRSLLDAFHEEHLEKPSKALASKNAAEPSATADTPSYGKY